MSKQSPSSGAKRIANGHAWSKHAVEFPEFKTADEFAQLVDGIIQAPTASKALRGGREAFLGCILENGGHQEPERSRRRDGVSARNG